MKNRIFENLQRKRCSCSRGVNGVIILAKIRKTILDFKIQELIDQWESSINSMKQRDREIKHEQDHLEKINEDIVSRQLMIKEKRAFLATESENNIELEKKIEIRERQNGKLREQKQYIEGTLPN